MKFKAQTTRTWEIPIRASKKGNYTSSNIHFSAFAVNFRNPGIPFLAPRLKLKEKFEGHWGVGVPSKELTYPTLGKGTSSSNMPFFWGDMYQVLIYQLNIQSSLYLGSIHHPGFQWQYVSVPWRVSTCWHLLFVGLFPGSPDNPSHLLFGPRVVSNP